MKRAHNFLQISFISKNFKIFDKTPRFLMLFYLSRNGGKITLGELTVDKRKKIFPVICLAKVKIVFLSKDIGKLTDTKY